jgi:hypothetical protein
LRAIPLIGQPPTESRLAFPPFKLTCVPPMLNYPDSLKSHIAFLVPIPMMIEDEHDDIVPALDIGPLNFTTAAERRAACLIVAAELTMFLGDDSAWMARVDLCRSQIVLERAFRDPQPAFDKLVAFCGHWNKRRAELTT